MKHHSVYPTANSNVLCSEIALNIAVSGITRKSPVRVHQKDVPTTDPSTGVACLNAMATALGHLPLYHSSLIPTPSKLVLDL